MLIKSKQKGLSIIILIFWLAVASMLILGVFKKTGIGQPQNPVDAGIQAENSAKGVVNVLEAHQQINQNAINQ